MKNVTARILTSEKMNALNSFDDPNNLVPIESTEFEISNDYLELNMPAKSVIVFELDGKINSNSGAGTKLKNPKPKLEYTFYKGFFRNLSDFNQLQVFKEGLIDQIKIPEESDASDFLVRYFGYVKIPKDVFYNFCVNYDDSLKLFIDGKRIINNDGLHAVIERKAISSLLKGFHKIEVEFNQTVGGLELDMSIEGPELEKQIIPAEMLFHESN